MRIITILSMNIKFKMPKFGRNLSKKGILKELLLTVIGTTISIILTFGTAHILEQRQNKATGRQTAMMVIHDIDNNSQILNDAADMEKKYSELTQNAINHINDLDSIPLDSLALIYHYISRTDDFYFDNSKEKIFHSGQEGWKNINNPQFIDLVQQFYYGRSKIQDYFNSNKVFIEPVTREEQYEHLMESPNYIIGTNLSTILRRVLQEEKVKFYLAHSPYRQNYYSDVAREWKRTSDQLKFIMGITDDELQQYVESQSRFGRRMKERDLTGKWIDNGGSSDHTETIEFRRNHSFTHVVKQAYPSSVYTGQLYLTQTLLGTWELEGDSLIRIYQPGIRYEFDKSQISYGKETKDSVERLIAETEAQVAAMQKEEDHATTSTIGRLSNAVYIDPSDSKMEINTTVTDANGKPVKTAVYMVREEH